MSDQPTTLGGALRRHGPNDWRWPDGTREAAASDLHRGDAYSYRVRRSGKQRLVEVPASDAKRDPALRWVLDLDAPTAQSGDHSSARMLAPEGIVRVAVDPMTGEPVTDDAGVPKRQRARNVLLVPLEAWDAWASAVEGCEWDQAEEARILATAEKWRDRARDSQDVYRATMEASRDATPAQLTRIIEALEDRLPMPRELLSPAGAADVCDLSEVTIRAMLADPEKHGGRLRPRVLVYGAGDRKTYAVSRADAQGLTRGRPGRPSKDSDS